MKKFLVLYFSSEEANKHTMEMPKEEMQASMGKWMSWAERCGESLVDMGAPLMPGNPKGSDNASPASGFSIIQAADMAGAETLCDNHPHLEWHADCNLAIHEYAPMPGGEG